MKRQTALLFIFMIFAACSSQYTEDGIEWLAKLNNDYSQMDIAGKWAVESSDNSDENSVDEIELMQDKNKITGFAKEYTVSGKISGENIYLHFIKEEYVYYILKLKLIEDESEKKLKGKVIKYLPIEDEEFIFGGNISIVYLPPLTVEAKEGK